MRTVSLWRLARWRTSTVVVTIVASAVAWVVYLALYLYPHQRNGELWQIETDIRLRTNVRTVAIEHWLDDLHGAAATIAAFPTTRQILTEGGAAREGHHLAGVLEGFVDTENLLAAVVLDPRGRVLVVAGDTAHLAAAWDRGAETQTVLTDFVQAADGRAVVISVVPVISAGRRVGTTVSAADPARWLYPFLEMTGDLPTYEILIVRPDRDSMVLVSPIRTGAYAPFTLRVAARPDLPSALAGAGTAGVGLARDYRGVLVIAASRRISGAPLILVAKVDERVALGPFRNRALMGYLQWTLLLGLALAIIARVAHRQRQAWERELAGSTAQREQVEQMLGGMATISPTAIVAVDLEGRVTFWNPAAERIFGWAPDEVLGKPLPFVLPEHQEESDLNFRRAIAGEPMTREVTRVRKDGTFVNLLLASAGMQEPGGKVIGSIGVLTDITRRREADAERALLSTAMEQAGEGIVITDAAGTIMQVNPAFERLTGYTRAEAIGKNPRILTGGRQPRALYEHMWSQLNRGEVWNGEFVNRRKDGTLYTAEVVISPVRNASGRIVNFVGFQRDVTRERERDDHLRHVQRLEAVGQLTGGIAHDFNNLLAVILMNAGALRQDLHLEDPAVRRTMADLEAAARRGAELVRKLMAFSRRDTIVREPVDLTHTLRETERTLRRLLPETIAIETVVLDSAVPVQLDAGAFDQIMLNLATNARDAMPEGGRLRIGIEVQQLDPQASGERNLPTGDYAVIEVADTGHGMDTATLERVFEPFFTTKPMGAGTGLGLSMIHGLMHQHDGFVTITSARGAGTTVRLCFPVHHAPADPPRRDAAPTTIPRGAETILLVEDEPEVRRGAARLLERLGYTVIVAANGEEALSAIGSHPSVALVISDAVMPQMSGPELLRRLRESGNRVPFVLASGYAAGGQVAAQALDPSVLTVDKPFTVETIARAVRTAIDGDGRH